MARLQDMNLGDSPKILVSSAAGMGKTRLIPTLPGKIKLLSAEAGLLSIRHSKADIDVDVISGMDDLRNAYVAMSKPDHGFAWVALDSISEIAEVCLAEKKASSKDPRMAYGETAEVVLSLIKAFRDLPHVGVYFTAKETPVTDEATGRVTYQVMFPGKQLPPQIPYLFDECFRLVSVENADKTSDVWILTRNDGRSPGVKDRSGALDPYEPCDLGAIVKKIQNNNTEQGE